MGAGADMSAPPMPLLRDMGIPIDEGARRKTWGASEPLWACGAGVGAVILHNGPWPDICLGMYLSRHAAVAQSGRPPPDPAQTERLFWQVLHARSPLEVFWLKLPAAGGGVAGGPGDAPPYPPAA